MGRSLNGRLFSLDSRESRSWLTASAVVTVLGIASVVPASTHIRDSVNPHAGANLLASESEASASLGDVLQVADDNAGELLDHFFTAFFPALQQETVDRLDLISQFPEDPTGIFTFVGDVADEMLTGMNAHFTNFVPPDGDESWLYGTINDEHLSYFDSYIDALGDDSSLQSLLDFVASPMSGVIFGIFAPYIGAELALIDDTISVVDSLGSGDIGGALQDALNEPTDFLDAFLNGYGEVDVSIPVADVIPGSESDDTIDSVNLGGLLSPGGSVFDSLGIDGDDSGISGEPFGEFGSLMSIQDAIAATLGWDGEASPIDELSDVDGFGWLGDLLSGL